MTTRIKFLEWGLAILGIAGVLMSALAIPRAGIGWDAGIDTSAALEVREIPADSSLADAYDFVFSTSEFYGVLIQWTADLLYALGGGRGPLATDSALTYQLQSVVTLTLSVVSAAIAAAVVAKVLRSRVSGLFTWALIMTVPLLAGLSVIDFKDSPIASAFMLVSSGACLLWLEQSRLITILGGSLIAMGTFLALGVRIGSWPLVGTILVGSVLASIAWAWHVHRPLGIGQRLITPAVGSTAGVIGVVMLNPIARIDLPRWVFDAFQLSRSYPWIGSIRTLGRDIPSTELPWWYAPAWFGAQMTLLFTLFVLVGLVFWFVRVSMAVRTSESARDADTAALMLTPFAIQALVLPVGLVVAGATLYDGIRHLAFAVPALVLLAAPFVARLVGEADEVPRDSRLREALATVLILAIPISGLVGILRWYPYGYAHVNVVTAAVDGDRDWEYDYWGTTIVEGATRLRELGVERVVVAPSIDEKGTAEVMAISRGEDIGAGETYGLYVFRRYDAEIPANSCSKVFEIARGGVILGEGALCQAPESSDQRR